ncbi:hypothetical protein J3R83DRAFT_582 [Lanmaoa asiatica]|nr:hypothetical protein J3R83DRAFT_582 [Lanmaoa asiatica]
MNARLKDPDVARLFENTFPNTIDTTVKYFNKDENLAFIITGDISAQWLRDTGNQFAHYRNLLSIDQELASLVKAVINNEARYISEHPYCGAFHPPPESNLPRSHNAWADRVVVNPPINNLTVFECKYELDSLCSFIKLSATYYQATKDSTMMNVNCKSFPTWLSAIDQIFRVMNEQSQPSFDADFNFISYYNWTGLPGSLAGPVNNGGNGELKGYTGMVGTSHRPSDDLSVFADRMYQLSLRLANAMLSVELNNLATILDDADIALNVSAQAKQWSQSIREAIHRHAVGFGTAVAINANKCCLGSVYMMDDANVPSLLSLPYLGFLDRNDPTYVKTKNILMSPKNPYYAKGEDFSGIGGPHIAAWNPWPMSQITNIFGSDDDDEILKSLYTIVNNSAGLGLIHESINIYNANEYTRSWFAWANSYLSEMILDLAQRKPHLIFDSLQLTRKAGPNSFLHSSICPSPSSVQFMSFTPHEIGTLIVVVLKAKNLPNKRHIGKQAPYCLVTLNEEKRRTKVIKRGGQHPEWDEEFRFTIFEDVEAGLVRSAPGSNTPPPLPPKKRGPKRIKGGNFMRLQCYADDARDPDFIGETLVDLTEALTKGETDEWFTLMNKDKYAGEVYVELTFWSNVRRETSGLATMLIHHHQEPPPEKKSSRKPTLSNKNYGGPGSFVPADSSTSLNGNTRPTARPVRTSAVHQPDSLPPSLRTSGSRPELYAPPYEQRNLASSVEQMANDFAELGVVDHRSRDNSAPLNQTLRSSTSTGFHPLPLLSSQSYEQRGQIEESSFVYDNAITPTTPQSRVSSSSSYYPTYEDGSVSSHLPPVRNHGPRYSMPTSSSGFVPISSVPTSSSYASVSYSPEPSTFSVVQGHPSHSPSHHPPPHTGYSPHHTHPGYTTVPSTPTSLTAPPPPPPLSPPSVASHRISHSLSASQVPDYRSYQLTSLGHEQAVPFPTQSAEYGSPLPQPTPVHSAPPQMYPAHTPTTPSPPSEIPPSLATGSSITGSRPLPQPGQFQRDRRYSVAVPPSTSFPQQIGAGFPSTGSFPLVPPIPPHYRRIPSAPGQPALSESMNSRPPPLPVPPPQVQGNPPPRPPALPQPPLGYHPVQPAYQPLPPPPLLPDMPQHTQLPRSNSSSFGNTSHFQGPAQRPPEPYPNYGQPLPTPPPVHGDWQ